MSVAEPLSSKASTLRRSQRVCLSVPITVIRHGLGGSVAEEDTRTLIVSAHGALLVLSLTVESGQSVTIKHPKTQEELVCRIVYLGPDQPDKREVGVEFEKAAPRFWGIAFPPDDWSPRSPYAKLPTAQPMVSRPLQKKVTGRGGGR
ncbi:MAG TPA: PilZ domain-containing protein [Candidatus Acidoferrum sp.]|nr:PilZ domain-containing protein [Candidatus Acidoferrum sp.]